MPQLSGHLELTCQVDHEGRSFLSHQACRVPFHVGKSYWDGQVLIVQMANPTAGLFAGDTLRSSIEVASGARLLLTTPSASRAHTMEDGRAELRQTFRVARGGWLEIVPELFIPQNRCSYAQITNLEIEPGGSLFFVETLAPGRVARGEIFRFTSIEWETNVRFGDRLVARERFRLRPEDDSLAPLTSPFPEGYFASCYLITDALTDESDCWKSIVHLNNEDVWLGSSRLIAGGWSIRILARDSLALRHAYEETRRILGLLLPPLRARTRKL